MSCSAKLGSGGLGRHVSEIVDALERRGQPTVCNLALHVTPAARRDHRFGVPYLATAAFRLARPPADAGVGFARGHSWPSSTRAQRRHCRAPST